MNFLSEPAVTFVRSPSVWSTRCGWVTRIGGRSDVKPIPVTPLEKRVRAGETSAQRTCSSVRKRREPSSSEGHYAVSTCMTTSEHASGFSAHFRSWRAVAVRNDARTFAAPSRSTSSFSAGSAMAITPRSEPAVVSTSRYYRPGVALVTAWLQAMELGGTTHASMPRVLTAPRIVSAVRPACTPGRTPSLPQRQPEQHHQSTCPVPGVARRRRCRLRHQRECRTPADPQ